MFQSLAILFLSIAVFLIAMKLLQIIKLLEIQTRIKEIEKNREYIKLQKDIYDFSPKIEGIVDMKGINNLKDVVKEFIEGEGYRLEKLEFSKVLDNKCDCPDCRKDNKNAKKK